MKEGIYMKKRILKTFSVALAAVMILSVMPMQIFAQTETAKPDDVLLEVEGNSVHAVPAGYFIFGGNYGNKTISFVDKNLNPTKTFDVDCYEAYGFGGGSFNALIIEDENYNQKVLFADGSVYEYAGYYSDLTNSVYIVENGFQGIVNGDGKIIIPCEYQSVDDYRVNDKTYFGAENDEGLFTLFDADGNVLLSNLTSLYAEEVSFYIGDSEHTSYGWNYFPEVNKYYMLSGDAVNGRVIYVDHSDGEQFGFLDEFGNVVVSAQYYSVENFSDDGLALVYNGMYYSYINKQGEAPFPGEYYNATSFLNGRALVKDKNGAYFIDTKGNVIDTISFDMYPINSEGDIYIVGRYNSEELEFGIIDKDGKILLPFQNMEITFTNVPNVVELRDIDFTISEYFNAKTGEKYSDAAPLVHQKNLYAVKNEGKWAVLNADGQVLTDFIYESGYDDQPYGRPPELMLELDGVSYYFTADGSRYIPDGLFYDYIDETDSIIVSVEGENNQSAFFDCINNKLLLDGKTFDLNSGYTSQIYDGHYLIFDRNYNSQIIDLYENRIVKDFGGSQISMLLNGYLVLDDHVVLNADGDSVTYLDNSETNYGNFHINHYNGEDEILVVDTYDYENEQELLRFIKAKPYDIDHIEITQLPEKTEYYQNIDGFITSDWDGETTVEWFKYMVSLKGMEVTVFYKDGTKRTISDIYNSGVIRTSDDQSYYNPWGVGEHEVEISYFGTKAYVPITIVENQIKSIELAKAPNKTELMYGEALDMTGAVLRVNYKNGSSKNIDITNAYYVNIYDSVCEREFGLNYSWNFSGDYETKPGYRNAVIEYGGQSLVVPIKVAENTVDTIEISGGVTDYIIITVKNLDGSSFDMKVLGYDVNGNIVTDKGVFEGGFYYSEEFSTNLVGDYYLEMFDTYSNTIENCLQISALSTAGRVKMVFDCFDMEITEFNGKVTAENIDDIATFVFFFYPSRWDYDYEFDYDTNTSYVPTSLLDAAAKYALGLENIDWTQCSTYDAETNTVAIYDDGMGRGPEAVNTTPQNGGWKVEFPGDDGKAEFTVITRSDGTVAKFWFGEKAEEATGDANGDGKISAIDARMVLQAVSGSNDLTDEQETMVDVNGDGRITAMDARWILQIIAGTRVL